MCRLTTLIVSCWILLSSSIFGQTIYNAQSVVNDDDEYFVSSDGEVLPYCSWYCGGWIPNIKATSTLKSYKDVKYSPNQAHDFNFKTAWVEGVDGYGIGESLIYIFDSTNVKFSGQGINELIIINGYRKSEELWKANSRVKKLKMYLNDKAHTLFELNDTYKAQTAKFPLIMLEPNKIITLKFEIVEVYKGNKYSDTAISELLFDGVGVHCFVEGTRIALPNGESVEIENLKVGDEILSYNFVTSAIETSKVLGIHSQPHHNLFTMKFNNAEITSTLDHPYFVDEKGWCSLAPSQSQLYWGFLEFNLLEVGDKLWYLNSRGELENARIISIEKVRGCQNTYAITKISRNNSYFANNILVGVEDLR